MEASTLFRRRPSARGSARQTHDRGHHVSAVSAADPAGADDSAGHRCSSDLAGELRPSLHALRVRLVGLHVRAGLGAIEYIVSRHLYQVSTMLFRCSSEVSKSCAVEEFSTVRVVFAQVHSGPCCAIDHKVGGVAPAAVLIASALAISSGLWSSPIISWPSSPPSRTRSVPSWPAAPATRIFTT